MKKISILLLLALLGISVSGCTSIKKMTGQTDDTVLPGQREDILPPDAQTAKDPAVSGNKNVSGNTNASGNQKQTACDPKDINCIPPIDQESSTPQ
jgi:hypothetical protein